MRTFLFLLFFIPFYTLSGQTLPKVSDLIKSLDCNTVECLTPFAEQHQYRLVSQTIGSESLKASYVSYVSYPASSNQKAVTADSLLFSQEGNLSTAAMTTASLYAIMQILPELDQELGFEEVTPASRGYADNRTYKSKKFPALVLRLIFDVARQEDQALEILKIEITETR